MIAVAERRGSIETYPSVGHAHTWHILPREEGWCRTPLREVPGIMKEGGAFVHTSLTSVQEETPTYSLPETRQLNRYGYTPARLCHDRSFFFSAS